MDRKRKGRPLLIAATGVALVSYACTPNQHPVGNLRPPERDDASIEPVGNLRPPEPPPSIDAGAPAIDSAAIDAGPPPIPPVGNLRPPATAPTATTQPTTTQPPKPPHPVGNLRPPPTTK